jgi:hypothetical protein
MLITKSHVIYDNGGSGRIRTSIVYRKGSDLQSEGTHAIVPTLPNIINFENEVKGYFLTFDHNCTIPITNKLHPITIIDLNRKLFPNRQ